MATVEKLEAAQLNALRSMAEEGIESGPSLDGEVLFARLRRKYASMPTPKPKRT